MSTIVRTTGDGLVVPADALEQRGVTPGTLLGLDSSPLPGPEEIVLRALRYSSWKLGDALGAGEPTWTGGEWEVELFAPDGEVAVGKLYLSPLGEVLAEKSATFESVRTAFHAASAPPSTTG